MNNFSYYNPTKIIFESDAELKSGEMLKEFGAKKVLIIYGSGSVIRTGLLDKVKSSLELSNIEYVTLSGVVPNPLLSKVYEGIELCKKENVDFILAVGGGSVIDSAKAIGMGLCYSGDVWDFFEGKASPTGCIPISTILTIAAAGSEISSSCVITKDEGMLKRYAGHEDAICKFALMNPELTKTLPDYQTASGCVDILMHTMERYFNNTINLDITDEMAQGVMRCTIRNAKLLKQNPTDTTARWNIMWAGSLSHNGLTGCGTLGGDWSTHDIEHELGGMFDVAHGAGLAAVWGSWARYVIDVIPHRLAKYAVNVLGITECSTEKETALKGIEATEEFFKEIGMPINLSGLGITVTEENIAEMAVKATHFGTKKVGAVIPLEKEDITKIYQMANK